MVPIKAVLMFEALVENIRICTSSTLQSSVLSGCCWFSQNCVVLLRALHPCNKRISIQIVFTTRSMRAELQIAHGPCEQLSTLLLIVRSQADVQLLSPAVEK
jgi:hypothetical protein